MILASRFSNAQGRLEASTIQLQEELDTERSVRLDLATEVPCRSTCLRRRASPSAASLSTASGPQVSALNPHISAASCPLLLLHLTARD